MCERAQIPLSATHESAAFIIDVLRTLSKHFADRTTMHGVFMDILGLGVLDHGRIRPGQKRARGLGLISRGNGLGPTMRVDHPHQTRPPSGKCPELLQNLLEVRRHRPAGHPRHLWRRPLRRRMRLKLIVHLSKGDIMERDYERVRLSRAAHPGRAGRAVLRWLCRWWPDRNIAVLVEAAVRNSSYRCAA